MGSKTHRPNPSRNAPAYAPHQTQFDEPLRGPDYLSVALETRSVQTDIPKVRRSALAKVDTLLSLSSVPACRDVSAQSRLAGKRSDAGPARRHSPP